MRQLLGLAIMIAIGSISPRVVESQAPTHYRDAVAHARTAIVATMTAQKRPGLSIAVMVEGKIVWSEGFGYADLENGVRVSSTTSFRIGSVSKPITAAAMARLYEKGRLDLDAPIQNYVPSFPSKGVVITARQLVGHLSGIRHYRRDPDEDKDEFRNRRTYYRTVTDGLQTFQDDPLDFTPGTKFGYTSYGYSLLSAGLEGASGLDYPALMEKEVFGPLKMLNTFPDNNRRIIPNRSRFYSLDENKQVINASYIDRSYSWAGGGLVSSAEDMARFGSAHLQAGYLKQETLDQMFSSMKTSDGKETGTGWGWRVNRDRKNRIYYFHPGENVGGRAYLWVYPKEKVVVAMAHNLTGAHLGSITTIADLFATAKRNADQ